MKERQSMSLKFKLDLRKFILAMVVMAAGIALDNCLLHTRNCFYLARISPPSAFSSAGLVFYAGIIIIVMMFENETVLTIALLLPSIVAVAIFVYGFHRLVRAGFAQ